MAKYLVQVESEFDRQQLRYLELIDVFGVSGVHRRLRELRQAQDNNESASVIAVKRRFLEKEGEWKYPVSLAKSERRLNESKIIHWSEIELTALPVGSGYNFLSLHQNDLTENVNGLCH